jgi:hypothetical protein
MLFLIIFLFYQLEFEQWKSILQSEHSEIPTKADLQDRLSRQLVRVFRVCHAKFCFLIINRY